VTRDQVGADTGGLLELVDRLESLLQDSGLAEIEIEAAGTLLHLKAPERAATAAGSEGPTAAAAREGPAEPAEPAQHAVLAPLTGIFYGSPSPEAAPYVEVGGEIHVGQVIGLIEAMKLFNEIKSDLDGRVIRIAAETGTLVRAKQPLVEVEPA
jgi:acetyl-CoA carboxylase biotin carboxyl carrier protein